MYVVSVCYVCYVCYVCISASINACYVSKATNKACGIKQKGLVAASGARARPWDLGPRGPGDPRVQIGCVYNKFLYVELFHKNFGPTDTYNGQVEITTTMKHV